MTEVAKWNGDLAVELLDNEADLATSARGGLMPALHLIQKTFGHVPDEARDLLADRLNLSRAEVLGVISFYDDFRISPAQKPVVRICRGEACQALGAEALFDGVIARDDVEVDPVFCLGNCACGPSVQVGGELLGRVSPERLIDVLENSEPENSTNEVDE